MPTIRKYAIRTASGWSSMSPAEQAEYYGTYTTLSAWWAATQSLDLPTLDIINQAVCFNDWPTGLVDSVSVSGGTSDSARYPMITVASGHRHNGIPGGNGFFMSSAGDTAVKRVALLTPYAVCEYIEVLDAYDSSGLSSDADGTILRRCIARGGATRYAITCNPGSGAAASVDSCLAYDTPSRGLHFNGFRASAITNCVVVNCGYGIVNSGGTSATLKNNVVFGCTTNYSGGTAESSNNAADDSTPPGSNPITGITSAAFVNAAANNFHLSGTSSVLYHAGVPVAGVVYDIDGDPYDVTTPSVGFDEIVAGGGPIIPASSQTSMWPISFNASAKMLSASAGSLSTVRGSVAASKSASAAAVGVFPLMVGGQAGKSSVVSSDSFVCTVTTGAGSKTVVLGSESLAVLISSGVAAPGGTVIASSGSVAALLCQSFTAKISDAQSVMRAPVVVGGASSKNINAASASLIMQGAVGAASKSVSAGTDGLVIAMALSLSGRQVMSESVSRLTLVSMGVYQIISQALGIVIAPSVISATPQRSIISATPQRSVRVLH